MYRKQCGRLQELFDSDYDMFFSFYKRDNRNAIRFGYDTLADLWAANPNVELVG